MKTEITKGKAKKKNTNGSQATFGKNRGRQVFLFCFFFPQKTDEATFFLAPGKHVYICNISCKKKKKKKKKSK